MSALPWFLIPGIYIKIQKCSNVYRNGFEEPYFVRVCLARQKPWHRLRMYPQKTLKNFFREWVALISKSRLHFRAGWATTCFGVRESTGFIPTTDCTRWLYWLFYKSQLKSAKVYSSCYVLHSGGLYHKLLPPGSFARTSDKADIKRTGT